MKKLFIFLAAAVLLNNCISCRYEDIGIDVSVLPEETATGQKTFGCVIDGWVYVGGRYYAFDDDNYRGDTVYGYHHEQYSILFRHYPEQNQMNVFVVVLPGDSFDILFKLNNPVEGAQCTVTDVSFGSESLPDGVAFITRFDTERHIISGRFECGNRLTHGRFDVAYYD
ncbi:MAG: hypothetical protein LBS12_05725 [Prevotellaceae bacterium]|jgi:hypothetical protein|nr:hypothetical protein [Prevotellaceae bacterium]